MNLVNLLQSLEDAVFEIVAWLMLLPKTFLRAAFKPFKSIEYVNDEFKKDAEKRFDEYLSPVIFWLLVAVIPAAYALLSAGDLAAGNPTSAIEESNLAQAAIIVLITPLIYMSVMEWVNKRPIRKSNLRRQFYVQCYLVSAPQLFYSLSLLFSSTSQFFLDYAVISLGLLIFYETIVFRSELKCGWFKAISLAIAPQLALTILSILYFLFSANITDMISSI
jgi:hypothetical protein